MEPRDAAGGRDAGAPALARADARAVAERCRMLGELCRFDPPETR